MSSLRTTASLLGATASLTFGLVGCGDPLVSAGYPGEPLVELEGRLRVADVEHLLQVEGAMRLGLFWTGDPSTFAEREGVTDFADQQVVISNFPGFFEGRVYAPPPPSVRRPPPGGGCGTVAIGSLLLYIDAEHNQRWDRGLDNLVGAAAEHLLLWTDGQAELAGLGRLSRGYHALAIDRATPSGQPTCGTPVPGFVSYSLSSSEEIVVLTIATVDSSLVDTNCNAQADEYDVCPPPPYIAEKCTDGDTTGECVVWQHCL